MTPSTSSASRPSPTPVLDIVLPYAARGAGALEVLADHPHLNLATVRQRISKARRQLGLPKLHHRCGRPLRLPEDVLLALKGEAAKRGRESGHALAIELLTLILRERMLDAILDEGHD